MPARVSIPNQLRLGAFTEPAALVTYYPTIKWDGNGHVNIWVARDLFVSRLRQRRDEFCDVTHSFGSVYFMRIIVVPERGTAQYSEFASWHVARNFYRQLRGTRRQHFLVAPPFEPIGPLGEVRPRIGGGGGLIQNTHALVVQPDQVWYLIPEILEKVGALSPIDRQFVRNYVRNTLELQQQQYGF